MGCQIEARVQKGVSVNSVTNYLRDKKVKFVEKRDNPPNVPECRPIEDFWNILKGEGYKNNWQAKDLKQLRNRITYCLKKIDKKAVQDMIGSTKRRLDNIRQNGLIENRYIHKKPTLNTFINFLNYIFIVQIKEVMPFQKKSSFFVITRYLISSFLRI